MSYPFTDLNIKSIYDNFPDDIGIIAHKLRDLIFEVAVKTPQVGNITETLRWGQPSYITDETKSGSTLRISAAKTGGCGIFAHCQTTIISTYAATFGDIDQVEGNRAVIFHQPGDVFPERISKLIHHGLTYHL